jgi:CRISPR-associated endonuclease/helicase Cas3
MTHYFAHSGFKSEEENYGDWQILSEHLQNVAALAKRLAEQTGVPGLSVTAEAAGWLHDLGKYRESFQDYIRGLPPKGSKAHKEAGAAWAARSGNLPLAFAILGHHYGIPDSDKAKEAVKHETDGMTLVHLIEPIARQDCPGLNELLLAKWAEVSATTDLFTRVLLACLVDADWTDTGEHERLNRRWPDFPKPPALDPDVRLTRLLAAIKEKAVTKRLVNSSLANTRQQILDACLAAAARPKGLYTLTVPTGGGKTLSGMAFALKHAATHDLRRVIYVAPYISILDQNANVIRAVLGISRDDLDLFEHQSLAEPPGSGYADEKQTASAARRAEKWDSPIVVTTNVQFFESLFSNKPGQCRKLHNIARSIIILDECQTLPPDLVKPTCQMLKQLVDQLGCTVVLCTATQPAFGHETLNEHRLTATEIIPNELHLFDRLKRVQLAWPTNRDERLAWSDVAKQMYEAGSALGVVNTKAAARELFGELKALSSHTYHLSTSMCPAHRMVILDEVKQRLTAKQPVFVASTQLIEAGVDVDFPAVFREMAPLESIIQAAGRCNREGLIANAGGRVVVFRSIEGKLPPDRWYHAGRNVLEAEMLAAGIQPRIDSPVDILDYFGRLYWKGDLDPQNIVGMRAGLKFESCAKAYRLIKDDTVPVVVATWQKHASEIETRLDTLRARPNRANFRALAPFQVNMFRTELARLPKGFAVPISEENDLLVWHGIYHEEIGRVSDFPDLIEGI